MLWSSMGSEGIVCDVAALPPVTDSGTHWVGGLGEGPTVVTVVVQTQPDHCTDWAISPVSIVVRVTSCHQSLALCAVPAVLWEFCAWWQHIIDNLILTGKALCNSILNKLCIFFCISLTVHFIIHCFKHQLNTLHFHFIMYVCVYVCRGRLIHNKVKVKCIYLVFKTVKLYIVHDVYFYSITHFLNQHLFFIFFFL
jgi:hypothetical protein